MEWKEASSKCNEEKKKKKTEREICTLIYLLDFLNNLPISRCQILSK